MQSRTIALVGHAGYPMPGLAAVLFRRRMNLTRDKHELSAHKRLWPSDLRQLPRAYGALHHFVSKGAGQ